MTSLQALLYIGCHTFGFFFRILGSIKMRFGHISVHFMKNISNTILVQFCVRKLVPGPLMMLIKLEYYTVYYFLVADVGQRNYRRL